MNSFTKRITLMETDSRASAGAERGNRLFSGAGGINQLIDLVPGLSGEKGNSFLFPILPANRLADRHVKALTCPTCGSTVVLSFGFVDLIAFCEIKALKLSLSGGNANEAID